MRFERSNCGRRELIRLGGVGYPEASAFRARIQKSLKVLVQESDKFVDSGHAQRAVSS
jgi:hypothetical protein